MNTELVCDEDSVSEGNTVNRSDFLVDKDMISELINSMVNGRAAGPTGLLSEVVKSAGEAEISIVKGLINQVLIGVTLVELKLGNFVNCCKRKRDTLHGGYYKELKLVDQIPKGVERVTRTLIKEQVDIN